MCFKTTSGRITRWNVKINLRQGEVKSITERIPGFEAACELVQS